jgi:hypothetical protein
VTPQDGWDFDCDWDSALISPDGDAATRVAEEGTPPAAPADQTWVGFGPTSDVSGAPPAAVSTGGGGPGVASSGSRQPSNQQQFVGYPALFRGSGSSWDASPAGGNLSAAGGCSWVASPFSQDAAKSGGDVHRLHADVSDEAAVAAGGLVITADSTWDEVQQVLGDGGRATIHSRGFASNPFGPTLVYGYKGVAFEALKNGHLAGLTLFEA